MRVVVATHNANKVAEFQQILGSRVDGLELLAYDGPTPVEDGLTFAENALIKARAAREHTGLAALADDSGISVDVLGGAPGIFSARWAGAHGDDGANNRLLLAQLADIRPADRGAQFVCALALVDEGGREQIVHGVWEGRVATQERGEEGFGYDPIFVPDGYDQSSAELGREKKNGMSHRFRALEAMVPLLNERA